VGRGALKFDAPELVERVFDAGFHPALWDPILAGLARGHGATVAGLAIHDGARFVVEPHVHGVERRALVLDPRELLGPGNPFQLVADRLAFGAIVRTELLVPLDELHRSALYEQCMQPAHAEFGLGVNLSPPGGLGGFMLFRDARSGPFSAEDAAAIRRLQPHLLGAVRVMRRLGTADLGFRLGSEVLERLSVPVFLCAEDGTVRFVNAAAAALVASGQLRISGGRLEASSPEEAAVLGRLIHEAACARRSGFAASGGTLALPRLGDGALELVIAPLAGERGAGLPLGELALVVASACSGERALVWLRERFGLTPAELRVALLTCEGIGLVEVARRLGVSINTARTHLQRVFDKTGTRRQADLVRLIARHPASLVREELAHEARGSGA
jgi:DNA-binding CsgD family transcriptional regulator